MIARALRNDILWSTFIQYFGRALQILLGILAMKMVTKAIGLDEYGFYGKISEYALFFSVIANLGIFGNVVRKMSANPKDGQLFTNALILRIVTALIFFLVGITYAWLFIPEQAFTIGATFFMGSLLFDYVTSVCDAMLQANYMMGRATFALVTGRTVNLVIVFLLFNSGVESAQFFFLGPLAAAFVAMSISLFFVRQQIDLVWKMDKTILRMLFITAIPFGIINIINNLYFRFLPSYFAASALSDAQFGSYNVTLHIAITASLFSTYLMFSTLPILKQSLKEGHIKRAKTLYKTIEKSMLALSFLTIIGGWFLGPFAIQLVSTTSFVLPEIWFVPLLLFILVSISYFYDLVLITLFALEKDIWFLKWEFVALFIASLILASSLVPTDPAARIFIVLIGAIIGEGFMVLLGTLKVKKCFAELRS